MRTIKNRNKVTCRVILALSLLAGLSYSAQAQGKIYWTDSGTLKIHRANLDGTGAGDLITGLPGPAGIAVDPNGHKIYWTDPNASRIQRANLNGTSIEDLVIASTPRDIAVDPLQSKIYWTQRVGLFGVRRANLDGTAVEDLVAGLPNPYGISVDGDGGKIYWTDIGTDRVQRANLDGTDVEDLVTGLDNPFDVALDPAGGKVYWTSSGKTQRANLDGTAVEDLVTVFPNVPWGIAVDPAEGKIYWTEFSGGDRIRRANLDGTDVEDIVTALDNPLFIALFLPAVESQQVQLLNELLLIDELILKQATLWASANQSSSVISEGLVCQEVDVLVSKKEKTVSRLSEATARTDFSKLKQIDLLSELEIVDDLLIDQPKIRDVLGELLRSCRRRDIEKVRALMDRQGEALVTKKEAILKALKSH